MALLLAPVSENASQITCTGCNASLVVTSSMNTNRLRIMTETVALDHRCSTAS